MVKLEKRFWAQAIHLNKFEVHKCLKLSKYLPNLILGLDSYLMSFSSVHDSKNKSLGRGSYNKVETKRTGLKLDTQMMPPIIDFCSNEVKESEWDSIICVHDNLRMATTWNYINSTMGKYKLENPRFKENEKFYRNVTATVSLIFNYLILSILLYELKFY